MAERVSLPKKPRCIQKRATARNKDALIDRLWRSAEQQITELEHRSSQDATADSERDARSLTLLVKVLRELVLLDAHVHASSPSELSSGDPRSSYLVSFYDSSTIDQLRQTLTERLARLGESGKSVSTSEPV